MSYNQLVQDLIATRKVRKFKSASHQNAKDHNEIMKRVNTNGVKIDLVMEILKNVYGGRVTVEALLNFAKSLAIKIHKRLDRLALRNRNALLCWYAENWTQIYPHLGSFNRFMDKGNLLNENLPIRNQAESFIDPSDIRQLLNHH
ncbi:hypothetical protein TVAG_219730 [Trichomonas vaginalis G3]|uniref:Uncharacterized protein n=1 Tax=Trichomonas vaginalis (strain ATCC PRA-98 / G3) TaxID=412133 RepID=A2DXT1_TRIV3|nr:hypothetical protein TVAGG3_0683410 [Trichomonas vaginalis G3]EAY14791.1 hypothetical protein TVAG_219730 [Trichomonas vaginalis G3]KAI5508066.1 hypothetical protein TVAGG3_0683410 [Trichomonas vaginalis G3]|eukprot:XP_001327014.1 hypothetical protein [Trichomonas vaginalis G3]